jgi:hypothetical protein
VYDQPTLRRWFGFAQRNEVGNDEYEWQQPIAEHRVQ